MERDWIQSPTLTAKASVKIAARALEIAARLRVSEKLALVYLSYVSIAATFYPVWATRGFTIALLNLMTSGVITLLSRYKRGDPERGVEVAAVSGSVAEGGPPPEGTPGTSRVMREPAASVAERDGNHRSELFATIRDWFPALLILLAYRESGLLFFSGSTHRLDYLFERWDRALLGSRWVLGALAFCAPWLQRYLEFSYLLCYPLVPMGLGALYALRQWPRRASGGQFDADRAIDRFWTTVLLAQFTCYALFPLFPSTAPRTFFHDLPGPHVQPFFRQMNLWILGRYGIQSSVFPSGHVAAVTATALSVRASWPRAGVVFALAAASIAVSTVIGRYHYSADALAGALIGVAAFLVSSRVHQQVSTPSFPRKRESSLDSTFV
jgi:membrane-associated phospholipid phosphatase